VWLKFHLAVLFREIYTNLYKSKYFYLLIFSWKKAAESQDICSNEDDKSRQGAAHRNITNTSCIYFGALHLLHGMDIIYYNYQRCSAPWNDNFIRTTPNKLEPISRLKEDLAIYLHPKDRNPKYVEASIKDKINNN